MTVKSATAAALLILAALLAGYWHGRAAGAESGDKRAEAAELKAKGSIVAAEASQARLEAEAAGLRDQLEDLKKRTPVERIVYVTRASTGPTVARGSPRPVATQAAAPGVSLLAPGAAPACLPCLLAEGDSGEVRCQVAGVETKAGNTIVVGAGAAWRLDPGPATQILGGPFKAEFSSASVAPPEVKRGRYALRGGLTLDRDWWAGGDLRLLGPLWVTADVDPHTLRGGVRWEF